MLKSAKKQSVLQLNDLFDNFRNENEFFLFDFKNNIEKSVEVKFKIK